MTVAAVNDEIKGEQRINNERVKEGTCVDKSCDNSCDKICIKSNCDAINDKLSCDTVISDAKFACDDSLYPIFSNKNSPNKIKLLTSFNPKEKPKNIAAFRKKKGKYYLAAKIASSTVILFADSAADISITDHATSRLGTVEKLTTPIKIRSFDNQSIQHITEIATLKLHFGSVIAVMRFYVCKTEFSIVGIDMLRNSKLNLSLNTKTEIFWIDRYPIKTSCSPEEAAKELSARMNENKVRRERKVNGRKQNWARSSFKQTAKPYGLTDIEVETDQNMDQECKNVFLSLFDGENESDEVYVPSMMIHDAENKFWITVENKSGHAIVFTKGTAIGEIKICSERAGRNTVMSYTRTEVKSTIEAMRNLTCSEISTEQMTPRVSHYGSLDTDEVQKVGNKNDLSKNGISPERVVGDKNQAPNRTQDEQTNNMQCSNANFGQKLGTPQICKLGEKGKTQISRDLDIPEQKEEHFRKEKNITNKSAAGKDAKTDFENSKILN